MQEELKTLADNLAEENIKVKMSQKHFENNQQRFILYEKHLQDVLESNIKGTF